MLAQWKLYAYAFLCVGITGVAARPGAVSSSIEFQRTALHHAPRRTIIAARDEEYPFLTYKGTPSGKAVQGGVKLRILAVGDSITVGFGQGADGNGYREQLRNNLSSECSGRA
jgi:hypothetical protein